jgi:Spy/CpxP family protein refolding chaperone
VIIAIALIVLTVGALNLVMTNAQTAEELDEGMESTYCNGFMERHHRGRGPWSELTEEQADELKAIIESMREAEAAPEEIHDAVAAKLEEWGYEVPPMPGPRNGKFGPWAELTEEQADELKAIIESMREAEAAPEEIHDAVAAKLEEWGYEVPPMPGPGPRGFQGGPKPGCGGYGGQRRGRRGGGPNGSTEGFGGNGMRFGNNNT